MIGSHNTYTYLKSTNWVYNNCKKWWKCQEKTIQEQYDFGVRFFDIRVYRDGNLWRACHGKVNLKKTWKSLEDICIEMEKNFPEAIYRIVLEKGDAYEFINETEFKDHTLLTDKYPNLWRIDSKEREYWKGYYANNNYKLFDRLYKFACVNVWEEPAHELHGFLTCKNFYKMDLRKEAKKINSKLDFFNDPDKLKEMIEDKSTLYFLDYCTNEY